MTSQLDLLSLRRGVREPELDADAGGKPGRGRGGETRVRGQRGVGLVPLRRRRAVVARPLAHYFPLGEHTIRGGPQP